MVQENIIKPKVLVICGPTASGKTSLSIECAKLLNSEVISADSMNVYKMFNIGTAKPTQDEMQGIKHHLIDVAEPTDNFSVGDYKDLALPILENLIKKGKIPVICGGTGFYINSLLYDFSYGNIGCDSKVRNKYKNLLQEKGAKYIYDLLNEVDPESAKCIHQNDTKRVIRALEIFESGTKKSDIVDSKISKYDFKAFSIGINRDILYERINKRVDDMINSGLVEEVALLKNSGINLSHQAMQGIGYKEIYSYLLGETSLENAIENLKLNTRHYAKRQITFFKKLENHKVIELTDIKIMAKGIIDLLW